MQCDVALPSFGEFVLMSELLYRAVQSAGTITCMIVLRGLALV